MGAIDGLRLLGHRQTLGTSLNLPLHPISAGTAAPRHNLDHAGVVAGANRGGHYPVVNVFLLEGFLVLCPGLARLQLATMDLLPLNRSCIADRLIRATPLIGREHLGKCLGDDGPLRILLVPAGRISQRFLVELQLIVDHLLLEG